MLIERQIKNKIIELCKSFPVLGIIGPRQSGKTTLLRELFPNYKYYNLESPDQLAIVENDPATFIKTQNNIIIDEVQRYPDIFSYIQAEVDEREQMGDFLISGSENLLLSQKISQSLAGRAAYSTLLPLSINELESSMQAKPNYYEQILKGFYPAIYSRKVKPSIYYNQYISTYVERDLRNISSISNLSLFRKFMALLAGRIGQVVNYSSLSNDVGVTANTIEHWISILEACYIVIRLQPFYNSFGKRYIKSPKIYFTDTGLACNLLGINKVDELVNHYLIGGLFENLCIMEIQKHIENSFSTSKLYYYRDSNGNEVDLIIDDGIDQTPVEIKSSGTFSKSFLSGLEYWKKINPNSKNSYVIYSGDSKELGKDNSLINWKDISKILS